MHLDIFKIIMLKTLIQPVTPFQQNASIVFCSETKKCAIVDPGGDIELLLNIAKDNNLIPDKLLLTHGHIDHAGGATELSWQGATLDTIRKKGDWTEGSKVVRDHYIQDFQPDFEKFKENDKKLSYLPFWCLY